MGYDRTSKKREISKITPETIKGNKSDIPTPPVLYKYYAFDEWTKNIFERNEIYFQSPDRFNDPFDSKIAYTYEGTEEQRIRRVIEWWRKRLPRDKKEEELHLKAVDVVKKCQDIPCVLATSKRSAERIRKQMGIFCMTRKKDNILMWSHYADEHRGFCLEFKTENPFFERVRLIKKENYRKDRPCLNLIEHLNPEDIEDALLTKAKGWKYEHEWRIIDHEKGPGVQTYPPEALSGVILGCRILPENRQRITKWCQTRAPQPVLYWAEVKDREFGLDIIPVKGDELESRLKS